MTNHIHVLVMPCYDDYNFRVKPMFDSFQNKLYMECMFCLSYLYSFTNIDVHHELYIR